MHMNRDLILAGLLTLSLATSTHVLAKGEPMYNFLPSDTVVENVKTTLQNHGVDVSAIQVDADAQGVVQLSGEVGSKQEVETVTQLSKQADGVYAVLGALRYSTGESIPAPVPEGLDPVMDSQPPAAGLESKEMQ